MDVRYYPGVIAAVLLVLAFTGGVSGISPGTETLEGTLVFSDAEFSGSNEAMTSSLAAAFIRADHPIPNGTEGVAMGGTVTGTAGRILVNWSYFQEKSVFNPIGSHGLVNLMSGQEYDEKRYENAEIMIPYLERQADLLLVPKDADGAIMSAFSKGGDRQLSPSAGERWISGFRDMDDVVVESQNFIHGHDLEDGAPIVATESPVQWSIEGDVTFYVWGAMVSIDPMSQHSFEYPSGGWSTNHTGEGLHPGGVAWDQHYQFLRIELSDANLTLEHERGPALWTAEGFSSQANGSASYRVQRGFLESSHYTYGMQNEPLMLEGEWTQNITESQSVDNNLTALINGDARIDAPPSQRISEARQASEAGSNGREESDGLDLVEESQDDIGARRAWWQLPVVLGVVLAAMIGMGVGVRTRQITGSTQHQLWRAEQAFSDGNVQKCQKLVKKVLAREERNMDAWFLYGSSLLKEGSYAQLVEEISPIARGPPFSAAMAFFVALAKARQGDDEGALAWIELVMDRKPKVREKILHAKDFDHLHDRPEFWRALRKSSTATDAAYA